MGSAAGVTATAPSARRMMRGDLIRYYLAASCLSHNIGAGHHQKIGGENEAMLSYSQSIQYRIKSEELRTTEAGVGDGRRAHHDDPQTHLPAGPSAEEMDAHLTALRRAADLGLEETERTRRANGGGIPLAARLATEPGDDDRMVGLACFGRPLHLPDWDAQFGDRQRQRCHELDIGEPSSDPAQSASGGGGLAAYTLFNVALLHHADRAFVQAAESYEISLGMLGEGGRKGGRSDQLLRIMILTNLGCLRHRSGDHETAARLFQDAIQLTVELRQEQYTTAYDVAMGDPSVRRSRRRLARANVATLLNLSRALGGDRSRAWDAMDVADAALEIYGGMEAEHSEATGDIKDDDDDGLDLSVLPYVRACALRNLALLPSDGATDGSAATSSRARIVATALREYQSFLVLCGGRRYDGTHPYVVSAMRGILSLAEVGALATVDESLANLMDHAAAA